MPKSVCRATVVPPASVIQQFNWLPPLLAVTQFTGTLGMRLMLPTGVTLCRVLQGPGLVGVDNSDRVVGPLVAGDGIDDPAQVLGAAAPAALVCSLTGISGAGPAVTVMACGADFRVAARWWRRRSDACSRYCR